MNIGDRQYKSQSLIVSILFVQLKLLGLAFMTSDLELNCTVLFTKAVIVTKSYLA